MFAPFVLELLIVFIATFALLMHYGRIRRQHIIVTVATLVSWYFSMIIVFIIPLDVSSTFYRECVAFENVVTNTSSVPINSTLMSLMKRDSYKLQSFSNGTTSSPLNSSTIQTFVNISSPPSNIINFTEIPFTKPKSNCQKPWSYVPEQTLPTMWRIVYWSSQFLTWLVLPLLQAYVCAGEFTILGKMKRAVVSNATYYISFLFIFVIIIFFIAISPSISFNMLKIKVLVITASNTWGLFLLILLLGYGLVEVPRRLWDKANIQLTLTRTYFHLSKLSSEKQEAHENLEDLLEEVKRISERVRYNNPSRKLVNIIISKCSSDFQDSLVSRGLDDYQDYDEDSNEQSPSDAHLIRLHKQLILAIDTAKRTNVQYKILMSRALHLENIMKNSLAVSPRVWKVEVSSLEEDTTFYKLLNPTLKWKWYCQIQPIARQVAALLLAVLTFMVIWSECTFFTTKPVLSIFALFINLAKSSSNFFYIELASCLVIFYLCFCAYYTVFRIKIFNYYYIAGHHQTNETSLLFVGTMLCRLTAPLCLNFLGLIHLDTPLDTPNNTQVQTSYTQIMGHLELITFISEGFNVYFPIMVLVLCVATYFKVAQRCLTIFGFQQFIDGNVDDLASDYINEGKQLVNREKRRIEREMSSIHRSKHLNQLAHDKDITNREWKGKVMKNAENRNTEVQQKENENVGLFGEESADYNSIIEGRQPVTSSSVTTKPPRNIFDDI